MVQARVKNARQSRAETNFKTTITSTYKLSELLQIEQLKLKFNKPESTIQKMAMDEFIKNQKG